MQEINFKYVVIKIIITLMIAAVPATIKGATWADNGVYSISWYNNTQTEFNISTPQELAGVAYLVNNNFTDFVGKTLNIISDIDIGGKDWIPIGTGSTVFQGAIEGNNHTVSNITINSGASGSRSGMWIKLKNSVIRNLNFEGQMNVDNIHMGFVSSYAESSSFDNININCSINYNDSDIGLSTSSWYLSTVAGMVGDASDCSFTNIKVNCEVNYTFGSSNGNNCYGYINLKCGGIVGSADDTEFIKCHAINDFNITINGYVTSTNYSSIGDSFVTYGGIVGDLYRKSSKIVGCLAENKYFMGNHACGTFDVVRFRFGGIVGCMSKYDSAVLKNCVAINQSYNISGHSYTWQAAWYHTNSYYGGIAYEVPENYAGCYSNNDVSKNISRVEQDRIFENGSTSFSESQMHSQSFVDELNFYSRLAFGEDYWTLSAGRLAIKQNDEDAGISNYCLDENEEKFEVYDLKGIYKGNSTDGLMPGIYIVRYTNDSKKVVIR